MRIYPFLPTALFRLFTLALVWWILTGGQQRDLLVATAVILTATAFSLTIWPPRPGTIRLSGWLGFAPWFFKQSVLGGFDVAMRALQFPMRIEPEIIDYQPRLGESGTILFMWTVSLLPGTACVNRCDKGLVIHFLQRTGDPKTQLDQLQSRIAALFTDESPDKSEFAK